MKTTQTTAELTIRFAGDSGDGIQFAGGEFAALQAILGHAVQTVPDYPAEIRAPVGTLPGVSGFQVQYASHAIYTPGDQADVLIALNPAALKTNLPLLKIGGTLLVNHNSFSERDLRKAGYATSPLDDGSLKAYQLLSLPISDLTLKTLTELKLPRSKTLQCRNVFALGVLCFMFDADLSLAQTRLREKFTVQTDILQANQLALKAGWAYAEASELISVQYQVPETSVPAGTYRYLSGNEAFAYAAATLAYQSNREVLLAGYPITPASTVLHVAAKLADLGVRTFQAEDEIAAMGAVLGAAYGGHIAITVTSGPGLDLKAEAIGLAVMTELPAIILDVQRAGPSTGMPTKVEQGDLLQAIYGRHGDCPLPVYAPCTPDDCYDLLLEVAAVAVRLMTPVIVLSDAALANGTVPWKIPDLNRLPDLPLSFAHSDQAETFQPYQRNELGARPWAIPGTPGLMHRIGGLEKSQLAGQVSYEPANHQAMSDARRQRIMQLQEKALSMPQIGDATGDVLLVTWGSCFGAVRSAVEALQATDHALTAVVLRQLYPLSSEFLQLLRQFKQVVVVELNQGQLAQVIRQHTQLPVLSLNKMTGKAFLIEEITSYLNQLLSEQLPEQPTQQEQANDF